VILSVYADQELLQTAVAAGAVGYLTKDTDPESLIAAIHAASEGKTTISPEIAEQLFRSVAHTQPGAGPARSKTLSDRELEILTAVAIGLSDKEIAAKLFLSQSTVKTHLRTIFRKLGARSRAQASAIAIRSNLIARPPGSGPS